MRHLHIATPIADDANNSDIEEQNVDKDVLITVSDNDNDVNKSSLSLSLTVIKSSLSTFCSPIADDDNNSDIEEQNVDKDDLITVSDNDKDDLFTSLSLSLTVIKSSISKNKMLIKMI